MDLIHLNRLKDHLAFVSAVERGSGFCLVRLQQLSSQAAYCVSADKGRVNKYFHFCSFLEKRHVGHNLYIHGTVHMAHHAVS